MTSVMKGPVDGVSPDGTLGVGSSSDRLHLNSPIAAAENSKLTMKNDLKVKGFIKGFGLL